MNASQEAQKERARREAEMHLHHSAVDRMREARMLERDVIAGKEETRMFDRKKNVRDANNAYAGEE